MFLSKDYFLANELFDRAKIHIANSSMLAKQLEEDGVKNAVIRMGNCTFFNKNTLELPNNIREYIIQFKDMKTFEDKIPLTFLKTELDDIGYKAFKNGLKINGFELKEENIANKTFVVFPKELVKILNNKTWYILNEKDYNDCSKNGDIDGGYRLKKDKYLVWY
jgi:hypothetical protein